MAAIHDFDRRWIFLAVGLLVVGLYAFGPEAPLPVSEFVESYYDTIESLPEGSVVMLSADFDPASAAELLPAYQATIHHLLLRNLRVINVATWPAAPPYMEQQFRIISPAYGSDYGEGWVHMGFLPGDDVAMGNIGQSLASAFPREGLEDRRFDEVPMLADVGDNMDGISLLITMSAGYPGILEWIAQVGGRYEVPILAATTAVQTPDLFAFYPNQLKGFLGAATGATQYLQMVNEVTAPGSVDAAMAENQRRMLVQSWVHVLIIALVVIGNVIYFAGRRQQRSL